MGKSTEQLKQIEALFAPIHPQSQSSEIAVVESRRDYKCDIHGGRRSSSGSITAINKKDSITSSSTPSTVMATSATPVKPAVNKRDSIGSVHSNYGSNIGIIRNGYDKNSSSSSSSTVPMLRKRESVERDIVTPNRDGLMTSSVVLRRRSTFSQDRTLPNENVRYNKMIIFRLFFFNIS